MSTTSRPRTPDTSAAAAGAPPERRFPAGRAGARVRHVLLPAGSLVLFLVLWQLLAASGTWSETLVPPPARVWDAFVAVSTTHDGVRGYNGTTLLEHLGISLRRIAIGAGLGIALGVSFGLLMGTDDSPGRLLTYVTDTARFPADQKQIDAAPSGDIVRKAFYLKGLSDAVR